MRSRFFSQIIALSCLISLVGLSTAKAAEYTLAIQPILPPEETREVYKPLLDYLAEQTGHEFKLVTNINYVSYWLKARAGAYDLVLDAPHFTAYRVQNMDYRILAKVNDTVSFSLVSASDKLFFSSKDLVGKRVTTIAPPSLSALALQGLYTNPMREPRFVNVDSAEQAINQVINGEAVAALIPTPIALQYPDLNIIQTTASYPHMALSAAPSVPQRVREEITAALLQASENDYGRSVLKEIKIAGFEPAEIGNYAPYAKLLTEGRSFQHASYKNP